MSADGTMVGFGYKAMWLAFRDTGQASVAAALDVRDAEPTAWQTAIDAAYDYDASRVAITPPLAGVGGTWVLAMSVALATEMPDIAALSAATGTEVQFFGNHRVVDYLAWARATQGRTVRAFSWVGDQGEVQQWVGRPTELELSLGLPDAATAADLTIDQVLDADLDEDTVLAVAQEWSVNPQSLDGRVADSLPLLGRLA